MTLKTHLTLGRVSNLPTVWTNVLAASALTGVTVSLTSTLLLLIAMSLFYIAGMYYNDACDADYDAMHQSHRPIPAGLISRYRVESFALCFASTAFLFVYAARMTSPPANGSASIGWLISTLCLIACIVIYNRHHKNNPLSPLLMAGCRICVLLISCYALSASLPPHIFLAILATLTWLIGLTFLAKHEKTINAKTSSFINHWPLMLLCIPVLIGAWLSISSPTILVPTVLTACVIWTAQARLRDAPAHLKGGAIALMIAGICLVDGVFLTWIWGMQGALISIIAFGVTLALQRWVAGT